MEKQYDAYWNAIIILSLISAIIPFVGLVVMIMVCIKKHGLTEALQTGNTYYSKKVAEAEDYYTKRKTEAEAYYTKREAEADEFYLQRTRQAEVDYYSQVSKTERLEKRIGKLNNEFSTLSKEIKELSTDVIIVASNFEVDESITSEEYKNKLALSKARLAELIKNNKAFKIFSDSNKKTIRDNSKQIMRCFEAESSSIIRAVTTKNVDTQRNKLNKSFDNLNKIFEVDGVSLVLDVLEYKLEELNLTYAYQLKKEQEKEEQRAIREQMLEEEKVRREIEREKAKIEKEETQFRNEISKLMKYLQKSSDIEKQLYIDKIRELEERLKLVEKDKENVLEREQNTRAGYVYVISNIGSFGEDIYKIGMTRRLEPMDRVKELGDASVPFEFDVHAMIFSEDAPTLETILHNTFKDKQVNKVNPRKEFFKVSLDAIETVVTENHNATVTFTQVAKAEQYRESLRLAELSENVG